MMGTQPYLVGERGPELFIPSGGGQIIPNNMLGINYGPSFNIPSNTISGVRGGANNSYNNNVYNIDIDLNGTNVSADDIMRRFKAELALINAKEGRVRTVGGSY
jgi:isocitrate lyase